jgi:hypothetical protein
VFLSSCEWTEDERQSGNQPADQASGDNQTHVTRGQDDPLSLGGRVNDSVRYVPGGAAVPHCRRSETEHHERSERRRWPLR